MPPRKNSPRRSWPRRARSEQKSRPRDSPDAKRGQRLLQPLPLISLKHQRAFFDSASAPQGALEILEPSFKLQGFELKLLDHGDLFASAALPLEPDDRARGRGRRSRQRRARRNGRSRRYLAFQ